MAGLLTNQKGFTLIETLIAFGILAVVSVGMVLVTGDNFKVATLLRDRTVAVNLAQEGLETVRNIRDSGWHAGQSFNVVLPAGTWRVVYNSDALLPFVDEPLRLDVNGVYQYSFGTASRFSRSISINNISSVEKEVQVTVSWAVSGGQESVTAQLRLFAWFQ